MADSPLADGPTMRGPVPATTRPAPGVRRRLHVVHVIHDFLPRHAAGSEIYAFELCRALSERHDVTVVCAEYAPDLPNGHLTWRVHEGVPVVEITNNWIGESFADTYRPALVGQRLEELLDTLGPDVLHVHNLLNLSLDLPAMARTRGIPVVATLHDYTWVCPSGGQRIHRAEQHVCHEIEPERCARCFRDTPIYSQLAFGAAAPRPGLVQRAGQFVRRRLPRMATRVASLVSQAAGPPVSAGAIRARLDAAVEGMRAVDLLVSPSPSLAREYERLGAGADRLSVSDYGFVARAPRQPEVAGDRLRIGYVGTIVWHKGVHVAVDAMRRLQGAGCELCIHGGFDVAPDYVADLRRRAAGLPVSFCGAFDRASAATVYDGIDLLVVPSIWLENSPLVIHEAFMAGVPVVASRIGGIVDLVRDGWNGWLVDPGSPEALAARLRAIVDDPLVLRLAAARLPPVKSIEADAAAWECRYHEVIAARREGVPS